MKQIIPFLISVSLISLLSCNLSDKSNSSAKNSKITSADTGIVFFKGTWKEALDKAVSENKPIFVDAYTVWCSPCKMMEKTVFTLPVVGKYYNEHFIPYRIDVEKGEGIDFAKKYTITGYPSFLFFKFNGEIAHHAQGSTGVDNADGFINLGKEASNPEQALFSLKDKYDKGNRESAFMLKYMLAKLRAYYFTKYCQPEMDEYIKLHPIPLSINADNWTFIKSFITDINHPYFKELLKRKAEFVAVANENDLNQKIYTTQMDYYLDKKEWKNYSVSAVNLMENVNPVDIWTINDIAFNFYEQVNDKGYLEKAKQWIKKAIAQETHYEFLDTYSHLLFKTGDKQMAVENAKLALESAKKEGTDFTDIEKWLDSLSK